MTLKIRRRDINDLHEDPANARKHGDRNLAAIQASIKEFGQVEPLVIQKGTGKVIGGNGRIQVLRRMGVRSVDVVEVDLDDLRATQLAIALNRTSELATWDERSLHATLEAIAKQGVDVVGGLSFTQDELDALINQVNGPDETQIQDPGIIALPKNPVTKPGDVWSLGDGRLICADATKPETWRRLLGKTKANAVITSPPYADKRKYDESTEFRPIPPDEYLDWYDPVAANIKAHLAEDGSYFNNIRAGCDDGQRLLYVYDYVLAHARRWGFRFIDDLVWTHGGTPRAVENRFKNAWEGIYHFAVGKNFKFRPERVMRESGNGVMDPRSEMYRHGHSRSMGKPGASRWKPVKTRMGGANDNGVTPFSAGLGSRPALTITKPIHHGTVASVQGVPGSGGAVRRAVASNMFKQRVRKVARGVGATDGADDPYADRTGLGGVEVDYAYPSNVLSLGKNREALGHSAAYPVTLPAFFTKAYTDPGDVVLDPFTGSGTTIIAAAQLGRRGYGIELSPAYCDVTIQRWERLTGEKAKRVQQ